MNPSQLVRTESHMQIAALHNAFIAITIHQWKNGSLYCILANDTGNILSLLYRNACQLMEHVA